MFILFICILLMVPFFSPILTFLTIFILSMFFSDKFNSNKNSENSNKNSFIFSLFKSKEEQYSYKKDIFNKRVLKVYYDKEDGLSIKIKEEVKKAVDKLYLIRDYKVIEDSGLIHKLYYAIPKDLERIIELSYFPNLEEKVLENLSLINEEIDKIFDIAEDIIEAKVDLHHEKLKVKYKKEGDKND